MTAFTDEEEIEFGTAENAPWLLARRLAPVVVRRLRAGSELGRFRRRGR